MAILISRDPSCDYYGNCWGSNWDRWGRWVAFAIIVGAAFVIFFTVACLNARRRRNHGLRPYAGTAWMAPPPGPPPPNQPIYQQPYYGNEQQYPQQPPPQYSANPQSYGYFGQQSAPQQNGIELQSPPNVHAADGRTYSPPSGPPPAKS